MFVRLCLTFTLVVGSGLCAPQTAPIGETPKSPDMIEVMILGTYHMANPGHDVVNVKVDDVLQPTRQHELEQLAIRLEQFHPTKVAIEADATAPDFVWKSVLDPADLKTNRNESYQIGERVALGAGLDKLYGVDADGDFDLVPLQSLDKQATGGERYKAVIDGMQQFVKEADEKQHTLTVSQSLAWMNTSEAIKQNNDTYMKILSIADGNNQPAAKLDAGWYERNLRIWGKILQIAKPGDRVIVVIGQGHAFWLRSLAEQMPGYKFVNPVPYLMLGEPALSPQ
jgi:hypothetical protein